MHRIRLMQNIIEGSGYWISISRGANSVPGMGKWKIRTYDPDCIYIALRSQLLLGGLSEIAGMKMRSIAEKHPETVYVYAGPYNDRATIEKVASELTGIIAENKLPIDRMIEYKTDLLTYWQKAAQVKPDERGKPEIRNCIDWLYKYDGAKLIVSDEMLRLHEKLENGFNSADPYFRSLVQEVPGHLFPAHDSSQHK
jgi:hypothetical protein